MPGRILAAVVSLFLVVRVVTVAFAAEEPTITVVPTIGGIQCDLCGWCPPDAKYEDKKPGNWTQCKKCLYLDDGSTRKGSYYTVFGCMSTDPSATPFVQQVLNFVIGVIGGIAFISMIVGIGIVMTSSGNSMRIQLGKDMITSSIVGLLLILFSVFILRVVGLDVLKIPGFG